MIPGRKGEGQELEGKGRLWLLFRCIFCSVVPVVPFDKNLLSTELSATLNA